MLKKDLAEALGISGAMVSKLVKRGMPTHSIDAARRWRDENLSQGHTKRFRAPPMGRQPATPPPPAHTSAQPAPAGDAGQAAPPMVDASYNEARARRERAEAEEAEMRTARIRGSMVQREDVERGAFEVGRELRDRLTGCARRIASEVAAISTADGCEAVIDREHRIVLELLVSGIRAKLGSGTNPP